MERESKSIEAEKRQDIWEKVYHTDARVTAMEGQIQDVHNSVARIETLLLNKKEPSPLAWFGVIFSILSLSGGMVALTVSFIGSSLSPIEADVRELQIINGEQAKRALEKSYETGRVDEKLALAEKDKDGMREDIKAINDKIKDLAVKAETTRERVEVHGQAMRSNSSLPYSRR